MSIISTHPHSIVRYSTLEEAKRAIHLCSRKTVEGIQLKVAPARESRHLFSSTQPTERGAFPIAQRRTVTGGNSVWKDMGENLRREKLGVVVEEEALVSSSVTNRIGAVHKKNLGLTDDDFRQQLHDHEELHSHSSITQGYGYAMESQLLSVRPLGDQSHDNEDQSHGNKDQSCDKWLHHDTASPDTNNQSDLSSESDIDSDFWDEDLLASSSPFSTDSASAVVSVSDQATSSPAQTACCLAAGPPILSKQCVPSDDGLFLTQISHVCSTYIKLI